MILDGLDRQNWEFSSKQQQVWILRQWIVLLHQLAQLWLSGVPRTAAGTLHLSFWGGGNAEPEFDLLLTFPQIKTPVTSHLVQARRTKQRIIGWCLNILGSSLTPVITVYMQYNSCPSCLWCVQLSTETNTLWCCLWDTLLYFLAIFFFSFSFPLFWHRYNKLVQNYFLITTNAFSLLTYIIISIFGVNFAIFYWHWKHN